MKTKMAIMPNGNYEKIISPVQHLCRCDRHVWKCVEYSWENKKLRLEIEDGDPCEGGYSSHIYVNYCPFCGYQPERLNPEGHSKD